MSRCCRCLGTSGLVIITDKQILRIWWASKLLTETGDIRLLYSVGQNKLFHNNFVKFSPKFDNFVAVRYILYLVLLFFAIIRWIKWYISKWIYISKWNDTKIVHISWRVFLHYHIKCNVCQPLRNQFKICQFLKALSALTPRYLSYAVVHTTQFQSLT